MKTPAGRRSGMYHYSWEDLRQATVGSDAEDVEAIQRFLGPASSQVASVVATCVLLDQATKDAWYALAKRLLAFNSKPSTDAGMLAEGRTLRGELSAFMVLLKTKGCGDVAQLVKDAPPPTKSPDPPHGTFFGALFSGSNPTTSAVILVIGVVLIASMMHEARS